MAATQSNFLETFNKLKLPVNPAYLNIKQNYDNYVPVLQFCRKNSIPFSELD
jgi:hypothetical protein